MTNEEKRELASNLSHGEQRNLEIAIALDPDDPSIAVDLARAYQLANRLADAAALAGNVARESPGSVRPLWILAEVREGQGDVEGALSAYAETLATLSQAPTTSPEQRDRPRLRMAGFRRGPRRSGSTRPAAGSLPRRPAPAIRRSPRRRARRRRCPDGSAAAGTRATRRAGRCPGPRGAPARSAAARPRRRPAG